MRRLFTILFAALAAELAGCSTAPEQAMPLDAGGGAPALAEVQLTLVDDQATGYATFQSHNQKVVSNRRGIFLTHLRSRNDEYTAQQWRLSWSRDGGRSFVTLFEDTHATNPPVLETDQQDNLYLIRVDFVGGDAFLYRFLAADDYARPLITRIEGGAAGKYAATIDLQRDVLYYLAITTFDASSFYRIALDGRIESQREFTRAGEHGGAMYPQLCLDEAGTLHAAWTTQKRDVYLYWDIHYARSPDGGEHWQSMAGAPLATPIVADDTGPADRITLDDEFEAHTFLAGFLVRSGKAHFLYEAQTTPPRQHYVRYDLATGRRDVHLFPEFRGEALSLRGLDGLLTAASGDPAGPLLCVMSSGGRIACLASTDQGATWRDHALSAAAFNPYSIGGSRHLTRDGHAIGTFTDARAATADAEARSAVYFFKVRVR